MPKKKRSPGRPKGTKNKTKPFVVQHPRMTPELAQALGLPGIYSLEQVAAYVHLNGQGVKRLENRDPSFPRGIKLSPRRRVYRSQDVIEWLQRRGLAS